MTTHLNVDNPFQIPNSVSETEVLNEGLNEETHPDSTEISATIDNFETIIKQSPTLVRILTDNAEEKVSDGEFPRGKDLDLSEKKEFSKPDSTAESSALSESTVNESTLDTTPYPDSLDEDNIPLAAFQTIFGSRPRFQSFKPSKSNPVTLDRPFTPPIEKQTSVTLDRPSFSPTSGSIPLPASQAVKLEPNQPGFIIAQIPVEDNSTSPQLSVYSSSSSKTLSDPILVLQKPESVHSTTSKLQVVSKRHSQPPPATSEESDVEGKILLAYAMERYEGGGVVITNRQHETDVPVPVFVKGGYAASPSLLEHEDPDSVLRCDAIREFKVLGFKLRKECLIVVRYGVMYLYTGNGKKCKIFNLRNTKILSSESKKISIEVRDSDEGNVVLLTPTVEVRKQLEEIVNKFAETDEKRERREQRQRKVRSVDVLKTFGTKRSQSDGTGRRKKMF